MPAPTTTAEFLEIARKSGLADEGLLNGALDRLRADNNLPPDPKDLATALVRQGVLSKFHAEQFLRGIWRGFHIGKYQILERIGSGGMGIVYLGEHKIMGNRVAIKVLPLALANHPWFLKRFYGEAQAVAAVNHPNIVRAFDIDRDGKLHFLVMEYVEGTSLQDIVSKYGAMEIGRSVEYTRQAALGLQHLHEMGLVHRDIKPGNLLLDRTGTVKILDLGLARFLREGEKEVLGKKKRETAMVGTDDYLAPEQIVNSDDVDARADIYSLGATCYFLLTGNSPFEDEAVAYHKLLKHLAQRAKPVCEIRRDVPEGLAALVEKMMAKNPWERPQSASTVIKGLAPWTPKSVAAPPSREMPRLCEALQRADARKSEAVPAAFNSKVRGASGVQFGSSGSPSSSGVLSDRWQYAKSPTPDPLVVERKADTNKDSPPTPAEPDKPGSGR
jgi:serine/threonine protein kinase